MKNKLPSFQFYPGDWKKDPGIQLLNLEERGFWFELLLLMFESEKRGYLLVKGQRIPDDDLARMFGLKVRRAKEILKKLTDFDIASVDPETGALYSRRLVRDEELRQIKKVCGSLGGNPALVNQQVNQNPTTEVNQNPTTQVKQSPTPSTSVSASSSASVSSSISENNKKDIKALARANSFEAPILYLNEKTGNNFDVKSEAIKALLEERYRAGRTFEDFKQVIDKKVEEWGHNSKLKIYLKPETLFESNRFEQYLNECKAQLKTREIVSRIARRRSVGNDGKQGF